MKHFKKFTTIEEYTKFISSELFVKPNISKIGQTLQYHKKVVYKMFDILWANSNGDKKVDSNILDPSEGYVPIGMCVAGTDFFGKGELARFISLKYMSETTPDTGDLSGHWINWGNNEVYMEGMPLYPIYSIYQDIDTSKDMFVYGTENRYNNFPSVFDANGNWNLSELGEKNQYVITDVSGKQHTEIMLNYATAQENWRTDSTITKSGGPGYSPAACCCWRYHTLGTQQGDWYLPAAGEFIIFAEKRDEFAVILNTLKSQYNNYVAGNFNDYGYLWTSTAQNNGGAVRFIGKQIAGKHKGDDDNIFAFIQL